MRSFKVLVAAVLILALAGGSAAFAYGLATDFTYKPTQSNAQANELDFPQIPSNYTSHAIPGGVMIASPDSLVVTPTKDGATITATLPQNNGAVEWLATYPNGAEASDSVKVTPTADSHVVTVQALKDFTKPITLTATQKGKYTATSAARIDCVSKIVDVTGLNVTADIGQEITATFEAIFDEGTLDGALSLGSVYLSVLPEFYEAVRSRLAFSIDDQSFVTSSDKVQLSADGKYTATLGTSDYSLFISDYADLDEAHKSAVRYAWKEACKKWGNRYNAEVTVNVVNSYGEFVKNSLRKIDVLVGRVSEDEAVEPNEFNVIL